LKEAKEFIEALEGDLRKTAAERFRVLTPDSASVISTARRDQGKVKFCDVMPLTPVAGWPGFVKVHRIYCFDFYDHEPEEAELESIFARLPGYQGDGRWRWFGKDEGVPPCLSADSDFGGLTVVGILREADWRAWDIAFQDGTSHFPMQRDAEEEKDA
jgi:hypothetical protein